jgi:hypothetical protein
MSEARKRQRGRCPSKGVWAGLSLLSHAPGFVCSNSSKICISPVCSVQSTVHDNRDIIKLLSLAKGLKELQLVAPRAPDRTLYPIGYTAFDIEELSLPVARLELLVLMEVITPANEFYKLFKHLRASMKDMVLSDVGIAGGYWVDMFDCLHVCNRCGYSVTMEGVFLEGTFHQIFDLWLLGNGKDDDCLPRKVLDYIHNRDANAPLRPISRGGSSRACALTSDPSLRYIRANIYWAEANWKKYLNDSN